jgi:cytochrome P450 family 6
MQTPTLLGLLEGVIEVDVLSMLAEFTDTLLAAQAFIFFLAGFETSSTTLSFCLHELALNPQVQERLREEIDSTLKKCEGKITYDAIQNTPYLDQVLDGE